MLIFRGRRGNVPSQWEPTSSGSICGLGLESLAGSFSTGDLVVWVEDGRVYVEWLTYWKGKNCHPIHEGFSLHILKVFER